MRPVSSNAMVIKHQLVQPERIDLAVELQTVGTVALMLVFMLFLIMSVLGLRVVLYANAAAVPKTGD